jgi:hypothetical protein
MRFYIFLALFALQPALAQESKTIYSSDAYEWHSDKIVQGKFTAKALSATEMTSDYQSPTGASVPSKITFKFSINGKDNEMPVGVNHVFNVNGIQGLQAQTPLIAFGTPLKPDQRLSEKALPPDTPLKIRLDMRQVLRQLDEKGFYTAANGDKIYKADFKKVYVAGATAPLSWDFDNLHQKPALEMKDPDSDGIYETTVAFNAKKDQKQTAGTWKLSKDVSEFPQYRSQDVLNDALYNLALEEMVKAVEPDSTFRTGAEWAGVWTRDIGYSIILSMAYLQPEVAMKSLMKKVSPSKRIIQDTGTGGAYPVSTDRIVWAVAAWEIFKATGGKKWLEDSYEIISNSIADDFINAYDHDSGLVRGESSFLDWREQTYPKWMQPADIYASQTLGTNAVHYQANVVMVEMAKILGRSKDAEKYALYADKIKAAVNDKLWLRDKNYYAQYRYGRTAMMRSARAEALGEALCVLFGIADQARAAKVIENTPQTGFGIPCIYPQIPGIAPYHNNAVWPFVQSYWALASAKAANEASVLESMAALARPAALFLTNKENFVADNGDFAGTEINSGNMLWSLSGSLAVVHKILFGISFEADKIAFSPFVPEPLGGTRTLSHFKYRNATLDITVDGFGGKIKSFTVDGKPSAPEILASAKGKHVVHIAMENTATPSHINKRANYTSPATPQATLHDNVIKWAKVDGAVVYQVFKNGVFDDQTTALYFLAFPKQFAAYQVVAVDGFGVSSFASEPVPIDPEKMTKTFEIEAFEKKSPAGYKGFSGGGFVETSKLVNDKIKLTIDVPEDGLYAIDFRYANGNGPVNTENKCAIRSLLDKSGNRMGTYVFPQRGKGEWSNWGFSNAEKIDLEKGRHTFTLELTGANENMNGDTNQAMLDYLRIVKIAAKR